MHPRTLARLARTALLATSLGVRAAGAQSASDSAAIRAAVLDYVEGWYEGDVARMERAVHPDLVKRITRSDPGTARTRIETMSAGQLLQGTRAGFGRQTAERERREDVRILDVFGNAAVARADMAAWVDFLQLARLDGRWVIVNVLWETRPRGE